MEATGDSLEPIQRPHSWGGEPHGSGEAKVKGHQPASICYGGAAERITCQTQKRKKGKKRNVIRLSRGKKKRAHARGVNQNTVPGKKGKSSQNWGKNTKHGYEGSRKKKFGGSEVNLDRGETKRWTILGKGGTRAFLRRCAPQTKMNFKGGHTCA